MYTSGGNIIKTRYLFLKEIYPYHIIIFVRKKELLTFNMDNKIINFCNNNNKEKIIEVLEREKINYCIIDNLDIVKKEDFKDNKYLEYKKRIEVVGIYLLLLNKIYNKNY